MKVLLALLFVSSAAHSQTLVDQGTADAFKRILGAARIESPSFDLGRVPAQLRVLTAEEIARSGARSLQELLAEQPGVVLFDEVGNGYEQTLDLRGFNATPIPTTVVLVDGVKINEPDFGAVPWHSVALSSIERVEIAPGPQTLYGKNALGGVVNVVTKKPAAAATGSAQAEFGSFDHQKYEAEVSGPLTGPLSYRFDASRLTELGYRRHSRARIHQFDGRLDYHDSETHGSLLYHYTDDSLQQAGSLTADEIGQDRRQNVSYVNTDNLLHSVAVNARRRIVDGWTGAFNGSYRQRLNHTPTNQGRTSTSSSRSQQDTSAATFQAEHAGELLGRKSVFVVGAELEHDKINADSSGVFGGFGSFNSGSVVIERQTGVFAQETFDLWPELVVLTAGVRHDRYGVQSEDKFVPTNNGSRIYHHASPRVGLNVNAVPGLQLFASLADAFRAPTADEINALGPFSDTPFLKPPKARSAEAGLRARFGRWGDGNVSAFRTMVHDEIFPVFDPTACGGFGCGQNTNVNRTRRDGVEVALHPRWDRWIDGFVHYSYTEATFQTDFTLDKAPFPATQNVRTGSFLPQVPRNRLALGINLHPLPKLTLSADELCVGSQYIFGDESNTEPRLGGYCLLGLGGSYERGPALVFLRIANALDRKYESRGILATDPVTFGPQRFLMPAPGISVNGGVRYRFLGT